MFSLIFTSKFDARRSKSHRFSLASLFRGLVPVDGDPGRVRPQGASDPSSGGETSGPEAHPAGDFARDPRRPAPPTHARNVVEEWIPPSILYGPPR